MPSLFDLHCDTAYKMYKTKQQLEKNTLAVDLEKFSSFDKKGQVFAIWSQDDLSDDEAFLNFKHISAEFKEQIAQNESKISLCTTASHIEEAEKSGKISAILAVEDARLIAKDLSRLDFLYDAGVRILTPGWKGNSVICGSYDSNEGLTDFGFEVVAACEEKGIIIDVSHLSEKGFWDVANKATKPFIASHSNASLICNHKRNLTDIQYRTIASCGGITGVNLVAKHLARAYADEMPESNKILETVCTHIEHFLNIDSTSLCLGLDFDGTEPLDGLEDVSKIPILYEALTNRGLDEETADKIFYGNARDFLVKALNR